MNNNGGKTPNNYSHFVQETTRSQTCCELNRKAMPSCSTGPRSQHLSFSRQSGQPCTMRRWRTTWRICTGCSETRRSTRWREPCGGWSMSSGIKELNFLNPTLWSFGGSRTNYGMLFCSSPGCWSLSASFSGSVALAVAEESSAVHVERERLTEINWMTWLNEIFTSLHGYDEVVWSSWLYMTRSSCNFNSRN